MGNLRIFLVTGSLVAMTACSPYGFQKEVGDLGTSTKGLTASVTAGHQALMDEKIAKYREGLAETHPPLSMGDNCFARKSVPPKELTEEDLANEKAEKAAADKKAQEDAARHIDPPVVHQPVRIPCGLYKQGTEQALYQDDHQIADKAVIAMKRLTDYTDALAAVTNAADRTNYDAAVTKLAAAVTAAGAAVGPAGAAVGAGINLFGWMLGNAFDIQRFESLKSAVNLMNKPTGDGQSKPFNAVVLAVAEQVEELVLIRADQLQKQLRSMNGNLALNLGPAPDVAYKARMADIALVAANLDTLNQEKNSPFTIANDLMKAHLELVVAVNQSKPDIGGLLTTLGTLKDKVSALQTALASTSGSTKKGA